MYQSTEKTKQLNEKQNKRMFGFKKIFRKQLDKIHRLKIKFIHSKLYVFIRKKCNHIFNMLVPFKYVVRHRFQLACWVVFVFILGQGIIFIDLVDIWLSGNSIENFITRNLELGNMYSFSLACLGANLFSFNLDIFRTKFNYKVHKVWINIIGICLMFFMIAGANSLFKHDEISQNQIVFQLTTYMLSIGANLYLLGIQLIEEKSINEEDDEVVEESNDMVEDINIDDKGCKL